MSDQESGDSGNGIFGNRADEEVYEAFPQRPVAYGFSPEDGLPRPMIQHAVEMALAPPLLPETLVCMADTSSFVIMGRWSEPEATFEASEVERRANGKYVVTEALAATRVLKAAEAGSPVHKLLDDGDPTNNTPSHILRAAKILHYDGLVEVQPVRPQCQHYARQMTDFQDDPDAKFVARLCTARRTDEGEFLSLRDSKVYACELRNPRDPGSEEQLDVFDAEKIRLGRERVKEADVFDVEAALAQQDEEGQS